MKSNTKLCKGALSKFIVCHLTGYGTLISRPRHNGICFYCLLIAFDNNVSGTAGQNERVDGGVRGTAEQPGGPRPLSHTRVCVALNYLRGIFFFKHLEQHSDLIFPPTLNSNPLHECLWGGGGSSVVAPPCPPVNVLTPHTTRSVVLMQ